MWLWLLRLVDPFVSVGVAVAAAPLVLVLLLLVAVPAAGIAVGVIVVGADVVVASGPFVLPPASRPIKSNARQGAPKPANSQTRMWI